MEFSLKNLKDIMLLLFTKACFKYCTNNSPKYFFRYNFTNNLLLKTIFDGYIYWSLVYF